MIEKFGIYVDGGFVEARQSYVDTISDPTRGAPFARISRGQAEDVDDAVRSASRALTRWSMVPLEDRIEIARRIRDNLIAEREEFAVLGAHETGVPIRLGRQIGDTPALIDAFVQAVGEIDFESIRSSDRYGTSLIRRRPVGVVAGILPWNAPLRSAVKKAIPAILAGCTAVLKPAPEAPLEAFRLAEIATAVGLPPGVINVVPGSAETGQALVAHPMVQKVAFTGSTVTGRSIAAAAGNGLKRLQLELGGKSAALMLEDVDVEKAAAQLVSQSFRLSGQTCTALTRAIVPASLTGVVVEALMEAIRIEVIGDPLEEQTTIGPLVSRRQFDRVHEYIQSARSLGAQVMDGRPSGTYSPAGLFVTPKLLTNVDNTMRPVREEIFGPILSVLSYDSLESAISMVNDSDYGLHGAVYSADLNRALYVASRFETGSVSIGALPIPVTAPFGGVKGSGIGREHGPEGFDSYLEYQSLILPTAQAQELARQLRVYTGGCSQ